MRKAQTKDVFAKGRAGINGSVQRLAKLNAIKYHNCAYRASAWSPR